jgi:hypothetical protein
MSASCEDRARSQLAERRQAEVSNRSAASAGATCMTADAISQPGVASLMA